ncbi:MAG: LacI family transcriptional regulator, partial [Actinomycetia bacterium]|nr:LacI family transcriptional regulator [Actinomycetes bacterium]
MAATLSDVSRRAGVSPATASRVLNGERYVSSASRMRVEAAARELGYVPNPAARDLSRARTSTIAFLVHHGQYPASDEGTFGARVLLGAAGAVAEFGYDLLYSVITDGDVDRLAALPVTHAGRAGGVLLLGPAFPRAAVAELVDIGRPLVLVDNLLPGADAVLADNRAGAQDLTRHLIERHRFGRIACLAGPPEWPSTRERV